MTIRSAGQHRAYMNHQTTHFTSAQSHVTADEDVIDQDQLALAPAVKHTPKRRRDPDAEDRAELVGARKRFNGGKRADERRLTGDYVVPKTAIPLDVPSYSDERGSDQEALRHSGNKMAGFKPINTLGNAPHASKSQAKGTLRQAPADFYHGSRDSTRAPGQGKLDTTRSAGGNVAARGGNGRDGDGFEDSGRTVKKQKVTHDKFMGGIKSDPVDLTDPEDPEDPVVYDGARGPGLARLTTGSAVASHTYSHPRSTGNKSSEYFQSSNLKTMDHMLNYRPKKARKPKDAGRLSQASQTPSIVEVEGGSDEARGTGARQAPFKVDGAEDNVQPAALPTSKRRSIDQEGTVAPTAQPGGRLPIDLAKGLYEPTPTGVKQGSAADRQGVLDVLNASLARNRQEGRLAGTAVPRASPRQPLEPNDAFSSAPRRSQAHQPQRETSPRLNVKFRRDDRSALPPHQKATQTMLENSQHPSSKVSDIGDTSSSDDALSRGNTIESHASRSQSPHKKVQKASQHTRGLPSNIKPTNFKQSRRLGQRNGNIERPPADPGGEEAESDIMPVAAFYAKSCVLTGGGTTLRYDQQTNDLEVYDGDRPAVVPDKKRTVIIGGPEARKVLHSHGSGRVFVTGSITDVSHGKICIAFADHNGVKWFLSKIGLATDDHTTFEHVTEDRLDATFRVQSAEIQSAAKRALIYAGNALLDSNGRRGQQRPNSEDEEQIQYEGESPQRTKLRRKMLGGNDEDLRVPQHSASRHQPERSPHFATQGTTRPSTRQSKRAPSLSPERWTRANNPKQWTQSVTYPLSGARRVTVEYGDLERLDEGQFLNDNIVSFALRRIEENMAPEFKDSVHFFNSFFYPSFTTKNGKKGFNYDAVKRWTKNKDIFSIPYIVVPICIDLHWFVAIICNLPNLSRKLAAADEDDEPQENMATVPDITAVPDAEETEDSLEVLPTDVQNGQPKDATAGMKQLSISDGGNRSPDNDVYECNDNGTVTEEHDARSSRQSTGSSRKLKKKAGSRARKYDPDEPAVVTLDSFGNTHGPEVRNLKDYLTAEAEEKRGMELDRDMLSGITAKGIPEQTNFCDCGVYLIGYIEQFATNPRQFVTKALSKELDQQADFASFNPSAKRAEIRDELLRLNKEQEEAHLAKKKQKRAGQVAAAQSTTKRVDKPNKPESVQVVSEQKETQIPAAAVVVNSPTREPPPAQPEKQVLTPAVQLGPPAHTVSSIVGDDDGDELDMAPARPLQPPVAVDELHNEAQREQHLSARQSSEEESGSDEMLDDNDDDDRAGAVDPTAPQASSSGEPLLDSLDKVLGDGPPSPAANAVPTPDADADAVAVEASAVYENHGPQSATPKHFPRDVEPPHHAAAEVPDSQEARPTSHSQGKQAKHTRFDD
ncbi:hypothetical protein LTR36_004477 [Oleoguttula mirabilis]|uniref:Ubiquitin-like protease family profile domain-containing protein n=1 Tax=Oleoguttula mirabilis TaxID=1507867 RepID=A0AAV9JHF2_9PEZI|nr:hypothetical protein LTR36_004477 [Oleoguttula mirabilis]